MVLQAAVKCYQQWNGFTVALDRTHSVLLTSEGPHRDLSPFMD